MPSNSSGTIRGVLQEKVKFELNSNTNSNWQSKARTERAAYGTTFGIFLYHLNEL